MLITWSNTEMDVLQSPVCGIHPVFLKSRVAIQISKVPTKSSPPHTHLPAFLLIFSRLWSLIFSSFPCISLPAHTSFWALFLGTAYPAPGRHRRLVWYWSLLIRASQIPYFAINFALKARCNCSTPVIWTTCIFIPFAFSRLRYTYQHQAVQWRTGGFQQRRSLLLLTPRTRTTRAPNTARLEKKRA